MKLVCVVDRGQDCWHPQAGLCMANQMIDLCIGWGPWPDEPFLDFITEHCARRKLLLVVCRDHNVRAVSRACLAGRKPIRVYLDAQADYEDPADPYAQLGYAARDAGTFVINEPDRARLGLNKAVLHYHFEKARIPTPYTVVVRNWIPSDFKLTPQERKKLGNRFIIKPARGYGKQGVARVQGGSVREIARARRFDRGDDFLLQEFIEPEWCGHHRGWFRMLYVLGEIVPCWWDNFTEHYSIMTPAQFREHELSVLCDVVYNIAETTHMNYFSTELAIVGRKDRRRAVSVDYVNDPPDMTVKSLSHCGLPETIVRRVAERIVDETWRRKKGLQKHDGPCVWFPR